MTKKLLHLAFVCFVLLGHKVACRKPYYELRIAEGDADYADLYEVPMKIPYVPVPYKAAPVSPANGTIYGNAKPAIGYTGAPQVPYAPPAQQYTTPPYNAYTAAATYATTSSYVASRPAYTNAAYTQTDYVQSTAAPYPVTTTVPVQEYNVQTAEYSKSPQKAYASGQATHIQMRITYNKKASGTEYSQLLSEVAPTAVEGPEMQETGNKSSDYEQPVSQRKKKTAARRIRKTTTTTVASSYGAGSAEEPCPCPSPVQEYETDTKKNATTYPGSLTATQKGRKQRRRTTTTPTPAVEEDCSCAEVLRDST